MRVAAVAEVAPGSMKAVKVGTLDVLLAHVGTSIHAIGERCTHVGGPLARGRLEGAIVQCPLHGSKFDVTTGAVVGGPAQRPEPSYPVRVEDGEIWVKAP